MSNDKMFYLALAWNVFLFAFFGYGIFWKGRSGWWFLVPLLCSMSFTKAKE